MPDKEVVLPNQCGSIWAETAKHMGATRQKKRAMASTPKPPAAEQIGALNCKQAHMKFMDPYSRGVSSG